MSVIGINGTSKSEIAFNLLRGNIRLRESDYLSLSKFKSTFRKLVARETTVNSKRELLSKHSVAVRELFYVFINTNPLDSDSDTEVFDSEDNSSGSSDINSSFSEDGEANRCEKVNSYSADPVSATFTSSVQGEFPTTSSCTTT